MVQKVQLKKFHIYLQMPVNFNYYFFKRKEVRCEVCAHIYIYIQPLKMMPKQIQKKKLVDYNFDLLIYKSKTYKIYNIRKYYMKGIKQITATQKQ